MNLFSMFNAQKSKRKTLQKEYDQLLADAMKAQRNGDIRTYSELTNEAEAVGKKLDELVES